MTELEGLKVELEQAERSARYWSDKVDNTLERYGHGVRPSWVSADIAIDGAHRDNQLAVARELRRKIERLEQKEQTK